MVAKVLDRKHPPVGNVLLMLKPFTAMRPDRSVKNAKKLHFA
jgi:hypothetical protein